MGERQEEKGLGVPSPSGTTPSTINSKPTGFASIPLASRYSNTPCQPLETEISSKTSDPVSVSSRVVKKVLLTFGKDLQLAHLPVQEPPSRGCHERGGDRNQAQV